MLLGSFVSEYFASRFKLNLTLETRQKLQLTLAIVTDADIVHFLNIIINMNNRYSWQNFVLKTINISKDWTIYPSVKNLYTIF